MEVLLQISVVGVHCGPYRHYYWLCHVVEGDSTVMPCTTDWRRTSPNPSLRDEDSSLRYDFTTPGLTTEAFPTATQLP
jgi:hypothetical protein